MRCCSEAAVWALYPRVPHGPRRTQETSISLAKGPVEAPARCWAWTGFGPIFPPGLNGPVVIEVGEKCLLFARFMPPDPGSVWRRFGPFFHPGRIGLVVFEVGENCVLFARLILRPPVGCGGGLDPSSTPVGSAWRTSGRERILSSLPG